MDCFGLAIEQAGTLRRSLQAAAWLHDLGKASSSFQAAIESRAFQVIRHEHLSALLLANPPLSTWLQSLPELDSHCVLAAVAGHHLKASSESFAVPTQEGPFGIKLMLDHVDCIRIFESLCRTLECGQPSDFSSRVFWTGDQVFQMRAQYRQLAMRTKRSLCEDDLSKRLMAAVRAALIAADAAGSALLREGLDVDAWIKSRFGAGRLTPTWIADNILRPRIQEVEVATGAPFVWHEFQLAAAALGPRGLILAPCGAGKTLAGWKWIEAELASHDANRVIFLYPTRATATEGFRDYVSWAGGEEAALLHGTSEFDLQGMFANPEDPRHGAFDGGRQALYSLAFWDKRIFSATVDQFLGFLQNQYASLCLLPVLAESLVVIDEVHSFDRSMFTALERFLRTFRVPVLCMTATLPRDRVRILADVCQLDVFPRASQSFQDLDCESEAPRYRIQIATSKEAFDLVHSAFLTGKRVLWVCNQVARCQDVVARLEQSLSPDRILCYHSRFRLLDRKQRHEDAIHRFRAQRPLVLVSTQVCEMSLNLDADLLVTELAPVPALIQRMGRCCRHNIAGGGLPGEVVFYSPENPRPYEQFELDQALTFVRELSPAGEPVAQAELARRLEDLQPAAPEASDGFAAFLDCGLLASSSEASFRDSEDFTVDAVLDCDIARWLDMKAHRDPGARSLILPGPRRIAKTDPQLPPYIQVVPSAFYDVRTGLHDHEVEHVF